MELGHQISDAIRIRYGNGSTGCGIEQFPVSLEKLGFRSFHNFARDSPDGYHEQYRWSTKVRVFLNNRSNLDLSFYVLNFSFLPCCIVLI